MLGTFILFPDGFDSAGEMSEETHHPRRTAPRTILTALGAAGLLGGLIILGGLLAAPSLTDGRLGVEGLSYVLTSSLGDGVGRLLLADVVVAIAVATLAIIPFGPMNAMHESALPTRLLPRPPRLRILPRPRDCFQPPF